MKNLKPTALPINTIIEFDDEQYIKLFFDWSGSQWETLACLDCRGGYDFTDTQADEKFDSFKIVAIDPEFKFDDVELHGDWDRDSGTFADGTPAHHCKGFNCVA